MKHLQIIRLARSRAVLQVEDLCLQIVQRRREGFLKGKAIVGVERVVLQTSSESLLALRPRNREDLVIDDVVVGLRLHSLITNCLPCTGDPVSAMKERVRLPNYDWRDLLAHTLNR